MKNILIAEDEEFNQVVLKDMLEIYYPDLTIRTVGNGKEALEVIREGWPDLVLSDIDMPEMNGIELVETVRKEFGNDLPMISITAYALTGDKEKMLLHGFSNYISKPIVMEELEKVLTPYLEN